MYSTVDRVQSEIKGTEANQGAANRQLVMRYIRSVSRRIDTYGFNFEPRFYTRKITPSPANTQLAMGLLSLGDNLLEPTLISVAGITYAYNTDILAYPDQGMTPIQTLRISNLCVGLPFSWYGCSGCNNFENIQITGFWGMRTYYNKYGWLTSDQTCPALNATQTTFAVTNVDGPDPLGETPLFSPGALIRIDNEMMDVLAVDMGANILTVMRQVRNDASAAGVVHNAGTPIKVWNAEEDVVNVATRQAGLLYARRGSYSQVTYPDGTNVSFPSDLLAELRAVMQRFNYI